MSPERKIPETVRTSHGFAIHIRNQKQEARREFQIIPSWEEITGTLELRTHSNYELNALYNQNRFILREFYDARYDIAVGKGSTKLNKFTRKYTQNEKAKTYDPELIDTLSLLFHIIRDRFPNTSRPRR